jgi:hypothetical protein
MGHMVGERWWNSVVISVFGVAAVEKCYGCDVCGYREYYFRFGCSALEVADV